MSNTLDQQQLDLTPEDNRRLANLCGQFDQHLRQIEQHLQVTIINRGHHFQISGSASAVAAARQVLEKLYAETAAATTLLTPATVHLFLQQTQHRFMEAPLMPIATRLNTLSGKADKNEPSNGYVRRGAIKPHSPNQERYLKNIASHDINFGVGPAGTGKTYLAVASAVSALEQERISRILLVRPAVEAGERLGFLPGDFAQKIDPYFRPLYDALYEMLGFDTVNKLIERHIIEVVPLAYMRGRTLNDAFIILDEAQNTTKEQMKMFLTRIGFNSKVVVTGDITQTDLPKGTESGLKHTLAVLENMPGISFTWFEANDVVRHPLVQDILYAYERHDQKNQHKYR